MGDLQRLMVRVAGGGALALALACGQTGGDTEAGEGSGSAASTTDASTTTAATTSSGGLTEGGGSGGETEGTTGGPTTGGPATTGTTGETTRTAAPETTGETTASSGDETGTSTGNVCDDFEQPGCIHNGCPEGQKCSIEFECVPTSCVCEPDTQDIVCTPDCNGGSCVREVACGPVVCNLFCEFGFKLDENGCEICECNEPPGCGCQSDGDCVKASPGCCSCNMGGAEVAVAKACVDQLEPCPLPPDEVLCPAVYLCTDAEAACVQGQCVLQ